MFGDNLEKAALSSEHLGIAHFVENHFVKIHKVGQKLLK
jgi:hypothetical protein